MENKQSLLLLVDGNALVHRAFHALPPLTTRTGETVGAVYGFSMMLIKALNDLKPSHYAIAFDKKAPTFRHILFEQYKAHRPAMADELVSQLGRVREVVEAFGLPIFELEGFEADDILGALSTQASAKGLETVIVTGDADIMQLVSPRVKIFYPRPGGSFSDAILYDEEAVVQRYGVKPAQMVDLKSLKGDPSDNIPGVPGVGDKTAARLVQQFGSIAEIYRRLEEVTPPRLRDKLKENEALVDRSRALSTIRREIPVTLDAEACCQIKRYDRSRVTELFRALGFNSLLAKLPQLETEIPPQKAVSVDVISVQPDYRTLTTGAELESYLNRLAGLPAVALSVEGTALSPVSSQIVGLSISSGAGEAAYIPVSRDGRMSAEQVLISLRPLLENPAVVKNVHNLKYALALLAENGVELHNAAFDTMLAAYLLGDKSLTLKDIVFSRLGLEMTPSSALTGSGAKQIALFQVDTQSVSTFACANADMTGRLTPLLQKELRGNGLWELFTGTELPLVPVLAHMERSGVILDVNLLKGMSLRLEEKIKDLEFKIHEHAKHEFNINSPKQLGEVLFEEIGLSSGRTGKARHSTEASVLEDLRLLHPIVGLILDYRQLVKLKSTYIDALPRLINPKTGRVHTSFNQTRTTTGRLSSSDPNLQNIPIRGDLGREIRAAFVAAPATMLLAGDYSQIDLRVLAHLSGDEGLLSAFNQNEDIHAATAAQLFGVDIRQVKPDMRRLAKTVNFGVIYGMSEYGLEQATELSLQEAARFIKTYFEKHPGIVRYLESTRAQARSQGFVQTLLGHRRYIPEINSPNRVVREAAERMAINMPVQGTSSDIIKVAMIRLYHEMQRQPLKSRLLLQVHDELIFEVPLDELEIMRRLVPEVMSGALTLSVPVKVDLKTGTNWGQME